MKNAFCFAILIVSSLQVAFADWQQTNGPFGGPDISCFARSGGNVFVGTSLGLFISADDGASWQEAANGIPVGGSISSMAVIGSRIFAASDYYGVFLSMNNGASWSPVNTGLTSLEVVSLAVSGTTLIAGLSGSGGIFRTTNYGTSWNSTTGPDYISTLGSNGSNVFAASAFGVDLSTNGGIFWSPVNNGLPIGTYSFAFNGNTTFAGGGGVYISTNNGTSWSPTSLVSSTVVALAVDNGNIFAGTGWNGIGDGIFLSTDTGQTWTAINNGLNYHGVNALMFNGSTLFAGTSHGGVFKSTDYGSTWTAANNGLFCSAALTSMAVIGTDLYVGAAHDYVGYNNGVYITSDSGATWTNSNNGLPMTNVGAITSSGSNLLAGTSNGVYQSLNSGATWHQVNLGLSDTSIWALYDVGSYVFAGTGKGVFASTNNGSTWSASSAGLPININVWDLISNGSYLFAATDSGVFASANNGVSWSPASIGLPANIGVYCFGVIGNSIFAGTTGGGIFLSQNNGMSWNDISTGVAGSYIHSMAEYGTTLIVACNSGTYMTTDDGAHWTNITDNSYTNVQEVVINGNNIFITTYLSGLWRRPLSEVITSLKEIPKPDQFVIYPNPISSGFRVQGSDKLKGNFIFQIYDMEGKQIFQTRMSDFNIDIKLDLPTGIYVYQLKDETKIVTTGKLVAQ